MPAQPRTTIIFLVILLSFVSNVRLYTCGVLLRLFAIALLLWVTRDYSSRLRYIAGSLIYKPLDVSLVLFVSNLYGRCSDKSLSTFYYIIVYLAELVLAPLR